MEQDSMVAAAGNIPSLFSLNFTDKTNAPSANTTPPNLLAHGHDEHYIELNQPREHYHDDHSERINQNNP